MDKKKIKAQVKNKFRILKRNGYKILPRYDVPDKEALRVRLIRLGNGYYEVRRINRGGRLCFEVEGSVVYKLGEYKISEDPFWWDNFFGHVI